MPLVVDHPILVTGAHRSGTTWVGQVFRRSPHVLYIPEAFNLEGIFRHRDVVHWWFQYTTAEHDPQLLRELERLFLLRYPANLLSSTWRTRAHRRYLWELTAVKVRHVLGMQKSVVPLLKDPIALLSAPWIAERFEARVIVLIRHPAAFYHSLKRLNWRFDFHHWTQQPLFPDELLTPFREQIANPPQDQLQEACLLWNCLYHIVHHYQQEHTGWHFLRHEDLSRDPETLFAALFQNLGIDFIPAVQNYIRWSSSGAGTTPLEGKVHQLRRDSGSNILAWKNNLSRDEIDTIHECTAPVSTHFYNDKDW